jgi:uncharacterized protein (TIGR02270 family)
MKLPDFAADPASVSFHRDIFTEHFEESAFLYQQRLARLVNSDNVWNDVATIEDRIEAHIEALMTGGKSALELCGVRAVTGDIGELFTAACVFCRQRQVSFLSEMLKSLDYADPRKVQAVADALKYELPDEWASFIEQVFARRDARLIPLLAIVSSYRRQPIGPALQQVLAAGVTDTLTIVEALGRMRVVEAEEVLSNCLKHSDIQIKSAALLALLRIGVSDALPSHYLHAQSENWPRISLGLGGNRHACNVLLEIVKSGKADRDCVLALGLLGDPSALQSLYDSLKNPNLVDSAALALNWITGAELFEDVFVPDEVNEDELFENELLAWRERKEAPKRADGKPFGQTIRKLSPNKDIWKRWFADNAAKFDMSLRYRSGKPYAPDSLLENLAEEGSDHQLRKFAAEELVIRYGCDVPFEVDMPVAQQLRAINEIQTWVRANGSRFRPGRWYFAGHSQS